MAGLREELPRILSFVHEIIKNDTLLDRIAHLLSSVCEWTTAEAILDIYQNSSNSRFIDLFYHMLAYGKDECKYICLTTLCNLASMYNNNDATWQQIVCNPFFFPFSFFFSLSIAYSSIKI